MLAGSDIGGVARAARLIGVSEPTLYRWLRAGNMRQARRAEVLRVHDLTGLPLEIFLRAKVEISNPSSAAASTIWVRCAAINESRRVVRKG
jgi:transposase-like protein